MELRALRARIQPLMVQDFDAVREEFVVETGSQDPRAFVRHLREWSLIPTDIAERLLDELSTEPRHGPRPSLHGATPSPAPKAATPPPSEIRVRVQRATPAPAPEPRRSAPSADEAAMADLLDLDELQEVTSARASIRPASDRGHDVGMFDSSDPDEATQADEATSDPPTDVGVAAVTVSRPPPEDEEGSWMDPETHGDEDATTLMRWDDDGEVDPDTATKHMTRAELLAEAAARLVDADEPPSTSGPVPDLVEIDQITVVRVTGIDASNLVDDDDPPSVGGRGSDDVTIIRNREWVSFPPEPDGPAPLEAMSPEAMRNLPGALPGEDEAAEGEIDPEADTVHIQRTRITHATPPPATRRSVPPQRASIPPTGPLAGPLHAPEPHQEPHAGVPEDEVRTELRTYESPPRPSLPPASGPVDLPADALRPVSPSVPPRVELPDPPPTRADPASRPIAEGRPHAATPSANRSATPTSPTARTELRSTPVPPPARTGGSQAPRRTRFELGPAVADDGITRTFQALDRELERTVAVRVLHAEQAENPLVRQRFETEIRVASQLSHPAVPTVIEVIDGGSYAHPMLEGRTLAEILAEARDALGSRRPLPPHAVREVLLRHLIRVCEAAAHAHDHGVLHRDLRPDNIVLGPHGAVWVVEWGIARPLPNAPAPIQLPHVDEDPRTLIGTPGYCSPEQANGNYRALDARSDVYALGLVLYEILTLRPAVSGISPAAKHLRQQQGQLDPLNHAFGAPIAPALREVVQRALQVHPDDRYPSAEALAEALRRGMRGESTGWLASAGRAAGRHPVLLVFVGLLLGTGWIVALLVGILPLLA